jgi:glycolate oxidase FAD binding subunit
VSLAVPDLSRLEPAPPEVVDAVPPAAFVFAPGAPGEVAAVLDAASERRAPVLVWGGGTHQGIGHRVSPEVVLSTARLDRVIAWEPDDLTIVVEAGATVGAIEARLAERGQTALLPETEPSATIGGVISAGVSGYRRARFGPTRDRVLQVTVATGDGRIVTGGGRVVKNVSGYDLPRIVTGSFGSLGVVVSVCLKLWPLPAVSATVPVADPAVAWRTAYRPAAVLQTEAGGFAYLQGTEAEVASQALALGGSPEMGFAWPAPPPGDVVASVRVRPSRVVATIGRLGDAPFVAQHGVGEVVAGLPADEGTVNRLRLWAEGEGGALVLLSAPEGFAVDPWGSDPPGLEIQRRLIAGFDPVRVINPGRLPGGV